MPFNELFDETLDINSTANYKLSIQVSLDGFYFSILDNLRNKFVLLRSFEPDDDKKFSVDDISAICSKDDFLNRQYALVNLILPTGRSTIVPAQLYDPAARDDYFGFNNITDDNQIIRVNKLQYPDSYLVFAAEKELYHFICDRFPGTEPIHNLKPFLHHLLTGRHATSDNHLHLHVEHDYINIVYLTHGELKLCNTFEYRNTSDLMYYLLYVAKKSEMQSNITLNVSGATVRFDEIWTGLSEYISKIKYSTPSGNYLFSYVFSEELLHRHLNLFTAVDCV